MLYSCRVRGRVFFRRRLHRLRGAVRRAGGYSCEFPNIRCIYITFWLRVYVWWLFASTYVLVKGSLASRLNTSITFGIIDIFTVVLIVLGAILGYCYHYGDCDAKSTLLRTL